MNQLAARVSLAKVWLNELTQPFRVSHIFAAEFL